MKSSTLSIEEIFSLVVDSAKVIKENFRKNITVSYKNDGTPVTSVDIACDNAIRNHLVNIDSSIGYISEESYSYIPQNCDKIAYIDPLDGTNAYSKGIASSTVVFSIMEKTVSNLWKPVMAIIHDPIVNHTWTSQEGLVTYFNQKDKCVVKKRLGEPLKITIATWKDVPYNLNFVREEMELSKDIEHQSFGGIALGAGLIASGLINATVFGGQSAVETTAMSLIVRNAGGIVTDLHGESIEEFELVKIKEDKYDFRLPFGAIMSSDQRTTDTIVKKVRFFNI